MVSLPSRPFDSLAPCDTSTRPMDGSPHLIPSHPLPFLAAPRDATAAFYGLSTPSSPSNTRAGAGAGRVGTSARPSVRPSVRLANGYPVPSLLLVMSVSVRDARTRAVGNSTRTSTAAAVARRSTHSPVFGKFSIYTHRRHSQWKV